MRFHMCSYVLLLVIISLPRRSAVSIVKIHQKLKRRRPVKKHHKQVRHRKSKFELPRFKSKYKTSKLETPKYTNDIPEDIVLSDESFDNTRLQETSEAETLHETPRARPRASNAAQIEAQIQANDLGKKGFAESQVPEAGIIDPTHYNQGTFREEQQWMKNDSRIRQMNLSAAQRQQMNPVQVQPFQFGRPMPQQQFRFFSPQQQQQQINSQQQQQQMMLQNQMMMLQQQRMMMQQQNENAQQQPIMNYPVMQQQQQQRIQQQPQSTMMGFYGRNL